MVRNLILCEQHTRALTKSLTASFGSRAYQVMGRGKGYRLRGAEVTVCKAFDDSVTVLRDSREMPVRLLAQAEEAAPVEDEKSVRLRVDRAKAEQQSRPTWKPAPDHPWRQLFRPEATVGRHAMRPRASAPPAVFGSHGPRKKHRRPKGTFQLWRKEDISALR